LLIKQGRQAYLVCIEGSLGMGEVALKERDAVKIIGKEELTIATATGAHLLAIEMAPA
jgi:redox-sensitive bicupin YhaK (pirin superfamily)